jgi:UDP-N-acetyl-D-glucosamine dehydrogenase
MAKSSVIADRKHPPERKMSQDAVKSAKSSRPVVGIIGLGYVGLPLARAFASAGTKVIGFDVDASKVSKLIAGQSYIKQLPHSVIAEMNERGFTATADFSRLKDADAILICVPTPLTEAREPDLTYVIKSAEAIGRYLRKGQLVVLESTTYPTTTRNVVLPILEQSGLKFGEDFYLAFSPEREDPGNQSFSVSSIPKVVGGLDARSGDLACELYATIVPQVVRVSTPEIAEACKVLENTYRAVNIALVNELKVLYDKMGIDVWEVIEAAKTKPFGFQAFYPGPGLGGHCIPIDPFYLTWVARQYGMSTRFIELAGEVNTSMPAYVIQRVGDALNDRSKSIRGSKIAILGMAYKKDIDDPRESPSFELAELLLKKGAIVTYNDPHIPALPKMRHYPDLRLASEELTPQYVASQDCVLIATDHTAYDCEMIVRNAQLVVDTRNATKRITSGREKIIKA